MFDNLHLEGTLVKQYNDALGWSKFLEKSDSYYPDTIRAFYCKAQSFHDKALIFTNLKGVEILLTSAILAEIMHLPAEGPTIFEKYLFVALNVQKNAVFNELFTRDSTNFVSTHLKSLSKIFNNINQHSILPHYDNHEFVSNNDALIIYHVIHCQTLNLPYIII